MANLTIYDARLDERVPATQADIERLERIASIHFLTRRILRRVVDFPHAVPASDEALKAHHDLLRKVCDLIESGHITTFVPKPQWMDGVLDHELKRAL